MKLVGIEFHGFKSFADSAQIRFHDGLTAIVGPNGCGKSNISDGLRWVLGEQRPTAIRGSRMEEAIFQGTKRRRPIQRAEVTLRLSNEDHLLPVPYSDVQISRTVFTGGESEYRLNGQLCRLRDIHDLCRDTGLGTNAYAIIEGRMIDAILSDRAEERRSMFEEAAGIGRYKDRRRIAARRLEEADADLARVDDVISEVGTKVRSLARQRGRARRFLEMRERKLALELALAHADLQRLTQREGEIDAELRTLQEKRVQGSAELRGAEAEHEALRVRLADLERARVDSARDLMAVRERLGERERGRLLAEERARHAAARLEQIAEERRELAREAEEIRAQVGELQAQLEEGRGELATVNSRLAGEQAKLAEVSGRRRALEAAEESVESERWAYHEQRARIQGSRDAARAEAEELAQRLEDAQNRLTSVSAAIEAAAAAEAEARRAAAAAEERWREAREQLDAERARLGEAQAEHEGVRGSQVALGERLRAVAARIESLRPLAHGEEGLNPAVRAALAARDELGIRAVLGQSIRVPEAFAEGIEAHLGAHLEGIVVDDRAAVDQVRGWFLERYHGPGGLVVLPLDGLAEEPHVGAELPEGIRVDGPALGWVRRLLHGVRLGEPVAEAGAAWIGQRESIDALGAYRFGRPYAGAGLLAHRAELERLEAQHAQLQEEAQQLAGRVQTAQQRVSECLARVSELETSRRKAEEEVGRLAARAEAAAERAARGQEETEAVQQSTFRLNQRLQAAVERAQAEDEALAALVPLEMPDAPEPQTLAAVRAEWEGLREVVTASQLAEARAAAACERIERELRAQQEALGGREERAARLGREADELAAALKQIEEETERAATDLEELFEEREGLERESTERDARADELRQQVADLESSLRRLNQEERSHSERHHELELERTQIAAGLTRTRERLEDEWGRSFEALSAEVEAAEGDPEVLRPELAEISSRLASIGLVNMLAEREYQEEKERLEFLEGQRADLGQARDDLRSTIREINETASVAFLETLERIRVNFQGTFATLFEGGECDVWLDDPEDPLDSPVEISASPRGKRTQRIHLLSGGERALTALALLFAIYLVKPSPFCVLDEVDAPLDETNILRFVSMLERFKAGVQFIVITHNPVTIEAADWIYGVTMEEPGVSKIVGVEFSEYARGAVA